MKRVEFFTLLLKSILIGFLLMVGCYTLWYAVDWRTAPINGRSRSVRLRSLRCG
ncbi:MAG UNVERIFIED_CONTAM: hypothetical protein LVT10_15260 [Anaerolineae bacterium]